jgi:hypothetical protein
MFWNRPKPAVQYSEFLQRLYSDYVLAAAKLLTAAPLDFNERKQLLLDEKDALELFSYQLKKEIGKQ